MTYEEILAEVEARHPEEAVGIALYDGTVVCLTNVAPNATETFEVDPLEVYMKVLAPYGHKQIRAIWHSHPGGRTEPSDVDWKFHPEGVELWIVAGGDIYEYESVALQDLRPTAGSAQSGA